MGVGLFNKLKKLFKGVGQRIAGFASKAIKALPQIAEVGKKVVGAVSPIVSNVIPGSKFVFNAIDKGLDYAGKFGNMFNNQRIGRSLIPEVS